MSVAEKLNTIADNTVKVFNAGYKTGYEEGKTESDDSLTIGLIQRDITEIEIPNGITIIGGYAFNFCKKLIKCKIPETVTTIENNAFENCTTLADVSLSSGLKSIGSGAFRYCDSITNMVIPNGVITIGLNAFQGCDNLKSIYIPDTVTSLAKSIVERCTLLENLIIECEIKIEFNLQTNSKLTAESAKSVLIALKNYAGTKNEDVYSVLLHSDVWDLLDAEGETAPGNITWKAYVDSKGWNY